MGVVVPLALVATDTIPVSQESPRVLALGETPRNGADAVRGVDELMVTRADRISHVPQRLQIIDQEPENGVAHRGHADEDGHEHAPVAKHPVKALETARLPSQDGWCACESTGSTTEAYTTPENVRRLLQRTARNVDILNGAKWSIMCLT